MSFELGSYRYQAKNYQSIYSRKDDSSADNRSKSKSKERATSAKKLQVGVSKDRQTLDYVRLAPPADPAMELTLSNQAQSNHDQGAEQSGDRRKRVTIIEDGDEVEAMIERNLKRNAKPAVQLKLAKNCDLIKTIEQRLWADNKVRSNH